MASAMKRRDVLVGLSAAALSPFAASAAPVSGAAYQADIAWLVGQIGAHYAYLPDRHVDLTRLGAIYGAAAATSVDKPAFLGVLEALLNELHDHHITLNTNNDHSPQLVPTGADIWVVRLDGRARVEQVRPGSLAEAGGVRAGDELVSIGGRTVADFLSSCRSPVLTALDPEADDFALRTALAGNHVDPRVFRIRRADGVALALSLPPCRQPATDGLLTIANLAPGFAAIRIENSLGETGLVAAFDKALEAQRQARGLILDLRNTPSGGDTGIAEPMIGRFIKGKQGYQRVFDPAPSKTFPKNSWVKQVDGRGPFTFTGPLVVLCSRWTGSMGEGMTVGLDGMKRAKAVGTRMASLCGGTDGFKLPNSGLTAHLPTECLYHIDGTPRERWAPPVLVDLAGASGPDPVLARGLEVLRGMAG